MSFHKIQAKQIVAELEKTHAPDFRLAAYVKVGENMENLTHQHPAAAAFPHKTVKDAFESFRRKFPFGQYLLIIVCGADTPEHPPKTQIIRHNLAQLRGTYRPAKLAEVLKLDTNWLDKAFEYQKRATY